QLHANALRTGWRHSDYSLSRTRGSQGPDSVNKQLKIWRKGRSEWRLPQERHRSRERCHRNILSKSPVRNRCQEPGRHERKRGQKTNVPFDLSLASRNLGKRPNTTGCKIVNPEASLGYGQKDGIASFRLECRLLVGLMQHAFDRNECLNTP